MGAWGTGLYSGDFAMDLRSAILGIMRLPLDTEDLLATIRSTEEQAASSPDDSDHANFWLVVADQFAKRGVDCPAARERALAIIDGGADLKINRELGMDEKSLAKRRKMLIELRARLETPIVPKPRKTRKTPQPLLCEVGDVFVYPTSSKKPRNPYFTKPERNWVQDGWGAMVIVERGQYLGYLAWYRPLIQHIGWTEEPTLEAVLEPRRWFCELTGTLSAQHEKRMELKMLGTLAIDQDKFERAFPKRNSPRSTALSDISIANRMSFHFLAKNEEIRISNGRPSPRIDSLSEIMA